MKLALKKNQDKFKNMTFEKLKEKYIDRESAFPENCPAPNKDDLNELIKKYNAIFPKSFVDFQLKYCKNIPMGDFAFEGFGFANNKLESYMSLEHILKDYNKLNFPEYLTPFKQDNGDFWCFDNRSSDDEYPVVIFDHNSNTIESDLNYKWKNFIDWLDKTMNEEF